MFRIPALVVGAGQAGLAMSRCLARRGIDHVVLERGRVAERWRSERWDSLRLLTPNWMTRLPDWHYRGDDPDGFMRAAEFADHLGAYACSAPVLTDTAVRALRPAGDGYRVETDGVTWQAGAVVIATGHCDTPAVPPMARHLPDGILQISPSAYRNPAQLPPGGVLVVGASATGAQIAEELQLAGRQVTLAVGRHSRVPRRYRGRDIWHWLDASGVLDDRWDQVGDIARARRQPSFQLVGRPEPRNLDLGTLRDAGIRLAGHVAGIEAGQVRFRDNLEASAAEAQATLERLLARLDVTADAAGAPRDADAARPFRLPPAPQSVDLAAEGVRTVVWATGYRRDYGWLQVPVTGADGEIAHDGGVTTAPGLYVLGLRFMRRRRSNFIDGVGQDAEDLAAHLAAWLSQGRRRAA
jgi:putative flavoprotein involved in K+ transport